MVHNLVAGIVELLYTLGIFIYPSADNEKGCHGIIFGKDIYKLFGVVVAPSGIEGQSNLFFLGLDTVNRQFSV